MLSKHWKTLKKPLQRNHVSFEPRFSGKFIHHVPEISFVSSENLIKAFYLSSKTKKIWNTVLSANISWRAFLNMTCTFLLFKASAFFKRSFREKQVLSFALVDKWNVNNSIENFTFLLCFMIRIKFFNTKERKTLSPLIS